MAALDWLDDLGAGPRRALLAGTAVALTVPTLTLELIPASHIARDAIAASVLLTGIAVWFAVYSALAAPVRQRREAERQQHAAEREVDRGMLATRAVRRGGREALSSIDPSFSLPVLHEIVLARAGPGDVRIAEIVVEPENTRVDAFVVQGTSARRVRLSRATDAISPRPELAHEPDAGGWRVDTTEPTAAPDAVPATPDPGMPAARRALMLRAEAFDQGGFEALITEIDAALEAETETPGTVSAYTTPAGEASVAAWRAGPGIPAGGAKPEWFGVREDGWYERIEVRTGARVLGLLRPSGSPEAPWRLWRLRCAP